MNSANSAPKAANGELAELIALAIVRSGRILLVAGGPVRWHREMGCTLVPLELPGGAIADQMPLERALKELGTRLLTTSVQPCSSRWVYGPSGRHAVDRRAPVAAERLAPVALLSRMTPDGDEKAAAEGLRPMSVRLFRATCDAQPTPGIESAGLLELPFDVLRLVVRGMPLAEVLAAEGVRWRAAQGVALPEDTMVYLPSEYGERYLLRVVAKYGEGAIVQDEPGEGPGDEAGQGQGEVIDEPGF